MSADTEFVHLHVHTDFSLLDGCSRVNRLCDRAVELGMKALSVTDHGVLYGLTSFYKEAKKRDLKPLLGCEVYLVFKEKMATVNEERKEEEIFHMGLLARNFTGYQNLCKLVSYAHTEGQYRRPRIDLGLLEKHSEGLIGFSGCLAAVIPRLLERGDFKGARAAAARFIEIFGKEFFIVEIMDHGIDIQRRITPDLLKIAAEFGLKVVATNDVHYVNSNDWEPHDSLLCIQTGAHLQEHKRMRYDSHEFYLKSRAEMAAAFPDNPEAILNTMAVAEMCDVKLPFGENHYPVYQRPIEVQYQPDRDRFNHILDIYVEKKNEVLSRDNHEPISLSEQDRENLMGNGLYLFDLCKQGLKQRYDVDYDSTCANPDAPEADKKLCDQLDYELAIIVGTGFADYFLIVWDFIRWARERDIPVGPGRGSGAGCVVAYVLKITDIEPLRFGLLFERMLNLERVSPPDFDVDFCMRRRDEVVNYVRDKYGKDRVANIITFGTFGAKMIVRDLARINQLTFQEGNRLAKMIPDELNISLSDSVRKSPELSKEVVQNPLANSIVEQGKVIEGMVRNTGKHACGIIIADQPITNLIPVTLQEGDLTTQYPKGPSEDLGLLKMDFLGLKTLTVIADAEANVRRTRANPQFSVDAVPLDDGKTYELLNSGRTNGVFQLESGGMQNVCRRIGLSKFEEIIALIAIYRPGPMQFIDQYIEGKKDPSTIQVPHPLLADLVAETYGVLIYQEQVMEAARIIAGYTLGNADILRRAMGKKIKSVMDAQKETFIAGAKQTHDIDRRTAEGIFSILEKFAQYGFNKSHSAAYAVLSYRTAYLKANYPVEFMAALLTTEQGNSDKIARFLGECSAMGIDILSPDVNESLDTFTPIVQNDQQAIRFGLAAIKNFGQGVAEALMQEREQGGSFKSFNEFMTRMVDKLKSRDFEVLIKTGAFDSLGEERGALLASLDGAIAQARTDQADRLAGQTNLFDGLFDGGSDGVVETSDDSPALDGPAMPVNEKLQYEKELLGFYISGHPMDAYTGIDTALDSFSSPEDLNGFGDRTTIRLCGIVVNLQRKYTRKDNKPMAVFNLATRQHSYEFIAFPEAYERFGQRLEEGQLYALQGLVGRRNGEISLSAHEVVRLESAVARVLRAIAFILEASDAAADFFAELRKAVDKNPGETRMGIYLRLPDETLVEAEIPSSFSWSFDPAQFKKLRQHPAVIGLRVEALPVATVDDRKPWEKARK